MAVGRAFRIPRARSLLLAAIFCVTIFYTWNSIARLELDVASQANGQPTGPAGSGRGLISSSTNQGVECNTGKPHTPEFLASATSTCQIYSGNADLRGGQHAAVSLRKEEVTKAPTALSLVAKEREKPVFGSPATKDVCAAVDQHTE